MSKAGEAYKRHGSEPTANPELFKAAEKIFAMIRADREKWEARHDVKLPRTLDDTIRFASRLGVPAGQILAGDFILADLIPIAEGQLDAPLAKRGEADDGIEWSPVAMAIKDIAAVLNVEPRKRAVDKYLIGIGSELKELNRQRYLVRIDTMGDRLKAKFVK